MVNDGEKSNLKPGETMPPGHKRERGKEGKGTAWRTEEKEKKETGECKEQKRVVRESGK